MAYLTNESFDVLRFLNMNGPSLAREIADKLELSELGTKKILARLETRGVVGREFAEKKNGGRGRKAFRWFIVYPVQPANDSPTPCIDTPARRSA